MVSVVIPVYNTYMYLQQCVDSVLKQTYHYVEVILVDDGSTDGSSDLCDEIEKRDSRVRTIHKKNGGLSEARNVGIKSATGKYIIFLDSDDFWIGNRGLSMLVSIMESDPNIDFINFKMEYYFQMENCFLKMVGFLNAGEKILKIDAMESFTQIGSFPVSACSKLLKTDFLKKHNLFFESGVLMEDIPWFLNLLSNTDFVYLYNLDFYVYRKQVTTSITTCFSEKRFMDLYKIIQCEVQRWERVDNREKALLYSFLAYEYAILMAFYYDNRKKIELWFYLKGLEWLLDYDLNPKVKKVKLLVKICGLKLSSFFLNKYVRLIVLKN